MKPSTKDALTAFRNKVRQSSALVDSLELIGSYAAQLFAQDQLSVWIWDPLHRCAVRLLPATEASMPLFADPDDYLCRTFFLPDEAPEETVHCVQPTDVSWAMAASFLRARPSNVDGFRLIFCLSSPLESGPMADMDRDFGRFSHYACEGLLQSRLREERDLIAAISNIASRSQSRSEFLEMLVRQLVRGFRAVGCSLFTIEAKSRRLVPGYTTGMVNPATGECAQNVEYGRGEGCTGWVWEHQSTVRFYNSRDPNQTARYPGLRLLARSAESVPQAPLRPFLCGPILGGVRESGDPVWGVLRIHKGPSDAAHIILDERLLDSIAPVIGAALERWEIAAKLEHRQSVERGLVRLIDDCFQADDPDPPGILRAVVDQAVSVFGASHCSVFLRRPGDTLEMLCETGKPTSTRRVLPPGRGLCGYAAQSRTTVVVADTSEDRRFVAPDHEVRSEMCAPVIWRGECLAVLNLDSAQKGYFRREDHTTADLLETFARIVASALRWQSMMEEATRLRELWLPSLQTLTMSATSSLVAHELKNGLCVISGVAQNLVRQGAHTFPNEGLQQIETILRKCEQLFSVIKGLLSRPLRDSQRQVTRVNEMVSSNARLLSVLLSRKTRLELALDSELDVSSVVVNRAQIEIALTNLVKNAAEASPKGSVIRVSTKGDAEWIRVSVSDHGYGIPAARIPQLFEPFRSNKPGGFGVGLAITRMIIEEHHQGRLEVSSTPGRGSIFTIWLPRARQLR